MRGRRNEIRQDSFFNCRDLGFDRDPSAVLAYGFIGHQSPPPITHPEFYFGFVGVTLAWQFAFLVIALDPARYRLMMLPSIAEKISYVLGTAALQLSGRISTLQAAPAVPDFILLTLFIASFSKLRAGVVPRK